MKKNSFSADNRYALDLLSHGEFRDAQSMLFKNAQAYKSHEAYNNLGVFLCEQGYEFINGKNHNADLLGFCYLHKAARIANSYINDSYLASVLMRRNERTFSKRGTENPVFFQKALAHLEAAIRVRYSDEAEYNRLLCLFKLNPEDSCVLEGLEKIVPKLRDADSVEFLMFLFCKHARFDECKKLLCEFSDQLDEVAKMTVFYFCEEYEKAAAFFETICEKFYLSMNQTAILVDSLYYANTKEDYARDKQRLIEAMSPENKRQARAYQDFMDRLFENKEFRKKTISKYLYRPIYKDVCGFFGCPLHQTATNNVHFSE